MDIFQCVNSKAIREYLKKIGYKFNSMEAIWLVYQNLNMTFDEKCKTWEEIMANMADMPYPDNRLSKEVKLSSIFDALKFYIDYKKQSLDVFKRNDGNCIFTFSYFCYKDYDDYCDFPASFFQFDDVINYINKNREELLLSEYKKVGNIAWVEHKFDGISIIKKHFGDRNYIETMSLNNNLDICNIEIFNNKNDEDDPYIYNIVTNFFDSMWFKFPVPFKKGDILCDPRHKKIDGCNTGPFVFLSINDSNGSCNMDMTAYGYFLYEDGEIYWECMHAYMDLEYYEEKISGIYRTLLPISNNLKGELELDLCVKGYHHILMQEIVKRERGNMYYTKEGIELMGVDDDKRADN